MSNPSSVRSVPLEVEALEDRRVLSTAAFASGLYAALLHRAASAAEVNTVTAAINGGGASPFQMAAVLTSSPEFQADLVIGDYQRLLHRAPSPAEANGWVAQLQQGLPESQFLATILASPEFFRDHGNTANGWLNGVYQDVLGRPVDAGGKAAWGNAIQSGVPLMTVAFDIVQSPESLQRIVTAAFKDVLGRAPDPQGLAQSTALLQSGMSPSQLEALLASSPEFIDARGGLDPRPVPVAQPVFVPTDTFFDPFFPGFGFGGCGCTGTGFTGGFTGGFSGGFSGGSGSGF